MGQLHDIADAEIETRLARFRSPETLRVLCDLAIKAIDLEHLRESSAFVFAFRGAEHRGIRADDLVSDSALAAMDRAEPVDEVIAYLRTALVVVLGTLCDRADGNDLRERRARRARLVLVAAAAVGTAIAIAASALGFVP